MTIEIAGIVVLVSIGGLDTIIRKKGNYPMNKSELIAAISEKSEITKKDVATVVEAYHDVITETLAAGDSVSIVGFGTYKPVHKDARECRNPATGDKVKVAAKTVAKFAPGKALAEAVNVKPKKGKKGKK